MTSVSPEPDNGTQRESDGESSPELSRVEPRPVDEETSEDESEGEEGTVDHGGDDDDDEDDDDDDEDEDDDEDDEPKLKYARLTPHLSSVYRNGDMTSSFLVAGDKMIAATHNGNIVRVSPAA